MSTREVPTVRLPIDVFEQPDALVIVADVPGVPAEKLDARMEHGELRIVAPRADGAAVYARAVRVPSWVDAASVRAALEHGVVTLTLPKAEAARPRSIPITES